MPKAHYGKPGSGKQRDKKVVYFPSCINQTMGRGKKDGSKKDLMNEVVAFLKKCGWQVIIPENMRGLCCGTIWESKGMPDIADSKTRELEDALFVASNRGEYPVICDQSPCLHRMIEKMELVKPMELMAFVHDFVADDLEFTAIDEPVALHITCSTRRMGIDKKLLALAQKCSRRVVLPEGVGCCGFAGDKGFNTPELNQWALRKLRAAIEANGVKRGFSNSRTCEIGLTTHSGVPYKSLIYLIDECSKPKKNKK